MRRNILFLWMLIASLGIAKANDVYVEVTSPEQLVVGAEYIIAAELSSEVYVATAYNGTFSSGKLESTKDGFTIADNTITIDAATPLVFKLGGNSSGYTLKYGSSYLGVSSSSTDLRQQSSVSNQEKWTYTYSDAYDTYLLKNVSQATRILMMHKQNHTFKAYQYSSDYAPAHLYKKMTETITAKSSNDDWGSVSIAGNTITATPADGYRVSKSNPYEVTEGEAEVIQDGNVFTVIPSTNCTIQINFEDLSAMRTHTVNWSVNGRIVRSDVLEENDAVPFIPAEVPIGTNKVFVGWVTDTFVDADTNPSFVTSANVTTDVTYYAVFAYADGSPASLTKLSGADFADGDEIVIVAKDQTYGLYQENLKAGYMKYFVFSNDAASVGSDNKKRWIMTASRDKWLLGDHINGYLYNNSGVTLDLKTDASTEWEITWSAEGGFVIMANGRKLSCRVDLSGTNQYSYRMTASKSEEITVFDLYKYVAASYIYSGYTTMPVAITLAEACTDGTNYYGTYSSGNAFVVPDDLTVSEIRLDDDQLVISNYEVGDIVPANTGVMVSSTTAGEHPVVLTHQEGTSLLNGDNCLYPSGDNGISAKEMGEAHPDCVYYRLTMHNGEILGYYWGAENGAAFILAPNKAYLALPKEKAARISGFDLADHEMTGIHILPIMHADGATYNLYGQRVGDSAKGIVIKNGKKQIKR